ncbi:MAG: selenide, water dikinase SelD, partial [Alphaproteobacteria bacterium]
PIVNDPVGFGMIAAANSLSDVYAMGAQPLTALNVVAFPEKGPLDISVLMRILEGGYRKATEAGAVIIGGHTVDDKEPKYGLAVTGVVDPRKLLSKEGTRPGDLLVLTKPIGTGILATALKAEMEPEGTEQLIIETCSFLNDKASRAAQQVGVRAVTDVTGFGLVLHTLEILEHSGVGGELWFDQIPLLADVSECLDMGLVPAGTYANRDFTGERLHIDAAVSDEQVLIANDAQTSGGLLLAVADEKADELVAALAEEGVPTRAIIGKVTAEKGKLALRPGK